MTQLPPARVLLRPALAIALFAAAASAAAVACGGSSATIGTSGELLDGGGSDAASGTDAAPSADGAVIPDAAVVPDATVKPDAAPDAAAVVHELAAPDCHDLVQQADLVAHVANPAPPPAQVPITTIPPGTYILTKATDYDGLTVIDTASSRTTVAFTATHQYYLSESNSGAPAQVYTLDWTITNNRLIRTILCAQSPNAVGTMVDYRIDGANNGFIIYVPIPTGGPGGMRTQAFRYTRVP